MSTRLYSIIQLWQRTYMLLLTFVQMKFLRTNKKCTLPSKYVLGSFVEQCVVDATSKVKTLEVKVIDFYKRVWKAKYEEKLLEFFEMHKNGNNANISSRGFTT